jgi:hypothetical protein
MRVTIRHRAAVVLVSVVGLICGCERARRSETSPTPTPGPSDPGIVLAGQVTSALTSAPLAGAEVSLNGRDRATTDEAGKYSLRGSLDTNLRFNFIYVSASGYESDYRFFGDAHDFRLHPIERIAAGQSTVLRVTPEDSLCVNNVQDFPGLGPSYHCRAVRVVAARAGRLTIDVVSSTGAPFFQVEVETTNAPTCCSERIQNPTSLDVTPGLEVVVRVEIPWGSARGESFVVNTTISPQAAGKS